MKKYSENSKNYSLKNAKKKNFPLLKFHYSLFQELILIITQQNGCNNNKNGKTKQKSMRKSFPPITLK